MAFDDVLNSAVNDDQPIVIGDQEITVDEAKEIKELLDQGKSFKELSSQYPDIDFRELPKSFTQTRQELAEIKKGKKEPENIADDEAKRRAEIDKFFEDPYVKEKMGKKDQEKEQKLREDLEFQKVIENLESQFDGSDGRPKFVKKDVLEHGMKEQIFNPLKSYKDLHEDALRDWDLKKALESKRPTTFFEKRGGQGGKAPDPKVPTSFREATEAALAE